MENWKDIKGFEGLYQVSDMGNVRSLDRIISHPIRKRLRLKGVILKPSLTTKKKYYQVRLCKNGKQYSFTIHQLAAMTFLNHKPDGNNLVVDHINDDSLDNRLVNLQILTGAENTRKTPRGKSKYVGVCWCKRSKRWKMQIYNKGEKSEGMFKTELEAHNAYQEELEKIVKHLNEEK